MTPCVDSHASSVFRISAATARCSSADCVDAREQRLGRRAPRRVVGLERGEHALDQALQVVAGVGGDPGDRGPGRQPGDLLREQHRLAVAGGRAEQHDPAGQERVGELRVQLAALDVGRAGAGRLELGAGEGHAASVTGGWPAPARRGASDGRSMAAGQIRTRKLVSPASEPTLRRDGYTLDIPDFTGFAHARVEHLSWAKPHGVRLPRDVLDAAGMAPDTPVVDPPRPAGSSRPPGTSRRSTKLLALVRRGAKTEEVDFGPPHGREAL